MVTIYTDNNADLTKYPDKINNFLSQGKVVGTGDGHGNGLRTMYTLIREGAMEVSPEDYAIFYQIYSKGIKLENKKIEEITKDDIETFAAILERSKINESAKKGMLDTTGDRVADRGENDIFELMIYEKLHIEGFPFRAPISNHDIEFYKNKNTYDSDLGESQARSLYKLGELVRKGIVTQARVDELAGIYQKHTNLLSYSFDAQGNLTLYSHAPTDLVVIRAMAEKIGITYPPNASGLGRPSNIEIAKLIDSMNAIFCKDYLPYKDKLEQLFPPLFKSGGWGAGVESQKIIAQIKNYPFMSLIWNRNIEDLEVHEGIHCVHGHTGPVGNTKGTTCIDTNFGKFLKYFQGTYSCSHAEHLTLEQLLQQKYTPVVSDEQKTTPTSLDFHALLNTFIKKLPVTSSSTTYTNQGKGVWGDYDWSVGKDSVQRTNIQNRFFKVQQNADGSVIILDKKNGFKEVSFSEIDEYPNKESLIQLRSYLTNANILSSPKLTTTITTTTTTPKTAVEVKEAKPLISLEKHSTVLFTLPTVAEHVTLEQKHTPVLSAEQKISPTSLDFHALLNTFIKKLPVTSSSTTYTNQGKGVWGDYDWSVGKDSVQRTNIQNRFFKVQQNADGSVIILDKKNGFKEVSFSEIDEYPNKESLIQLRSYLTNANTFLKEEPLLTIATTQKTALEVKEAKPLILFEKHSATLFTLPTVSSTDLSVKTFLEMVKKDAQQFSLSDTPYTILDANYVKENYGFIGADPRFGFKIGIGTSQANKGNFYIEDPKFSVQLKNNGEIFYFNRVTLLPATTEEISKSNLVIKIQEALEKVTQQKLCVFKM